jgi:hypothetical protein
MKQPPHFQSTSSVTILCSPDLKQILKGKEYGGVEAAEHWFGDSSQNSKVLRGASSTRIC